MRATEVPLNAARGFAMGAADVVPGVSGGTIALVLGIYARLIATVKAGSSALGRLVAGDGAGAGDWLRRIEWGFLLPLVAGILVAVITIARVIDRLLAEQPIVMAAIFFGLVVGSIVVAWRIGNDRGTLRIAVAAGVAIVTFVALGARSGTTDETVGQVVDPALWGFFASGALAICAMILPGISGSLILVLIGMYGPVLAAVNDRDLGRIALFAAGAVIGLALFSQLLHWALAAHHDTVMAGLIGLMAGSVRVLWPWPGGIDSTTLGRPSDAVFGAVLAATISFVVVIVISRLARSRANATP